MHPPPSPADAPPPTAARAGRAARVAVVGAGLAGIAAARRLRGAGLVVALFDKGRAAGGRVATRRATAAGERRLAFDHGAQYLTARGPSFAAALDAAGAAPWGDPARGWRVGAPGMSALPRALAAGLDLRTSRHVVGLSPSGTGLTLRHHDAALLRPGAPPPDAEPEASGPYDAVLVAVPSVQAAPLVVPHAPALAEAAASAVVAPCWTVMLAFDGRLDAPDHLRPEGQPGVVGWAARDSSKPGRDASAECWVVQATPAWSRAHLERAPADVLPDLVAAFAAVVGRPLPPVLHAEAHRWRYSLVERPLGRPCLWDAGLRVGLAGDWCLGGRAEAAWDSGEALARAVAEALAPAPAWTAPA